MKTLFLLTLAVFVPALAAAEPGRGAALDALASVLPEKNPNADPSYLDLAAPTLPDALAQCRWAPAEMGSIERIVALFDKDLQADGSGKDQLLKDLAALPDFKGMDKDPERRKNFAMLKLGIRLAPDITRARLVNDDCRALLRFHFANGASRAELRAEIARERASLEAAPAPR